MFFHPKQAINLLPPNIRAIDLMPLGERCSGRGSASASPSPSLPLDPGMGVTAPLHRRRHRTRRCSSDRQAALLRPPPAGRGNGRVLWDPHPVLVQGPAWRDSSGGAAPVRAPLALNRTPRPGRFCVSDDGPPQGGGLTVSGDSVPGDSPRRRGVPAPAIPLPVPPSRGGAAVSIAFPDRVGPPLGGRFVRDCPTPDEYHRALHPLSNKLPGAGVMTRRPAF